MHQQPPKTPLFASTSPANASQLDSSRALIVYPDPTSTQPSPRGRVALGWASVPRMTSGRREVSYRIKVCVLQMLHRLSCFYAGPERLGGTIRRSTALA